MKPAPDADAKSEAHAAIPNHEHPVCLIIGGLNLPARHIRTRFYGDAGEEGSRGLAYPDWGSTL